MDATWATVWATFIGPISAIVITLVRDHYASKRERRMHVFRSLMATRRLTINVKHVEALNLVEVEFYGVKPVEIAWAAYIANLNTPRALSATSSEAERLIKAREDLLAKLISAIGTHLGFKLSEIDVKNGGYAPDGWRYRDDRLGLIQEYAVALSTGKATLPVSVPQAASAPPEA